MRSRSRDVVAKELKKIPKGKLGNTPIRSLLDSLYAIPQVTVTETQIQHTTQKETGKSQGILRLKLEVQRDASNVKKDDKDEFATIVVVLGTRERRMILAQTDVAIGAFKTKMSMERELNFDWDVANADGGEGGGSVILRILQDNTRGMDSEVQVKLR